MRPFSKKEWGSGNDCLLGHTEPKTPFEAISMDVTGPYPTTPRGDKYLLTFIYRLTKYVEAFPISDRTDETCARMYSTQNFTRYDTGSTLITYQGREFVIFLSKNLQKIRCPQVAYFQLSTGFERESRKATPSAPFGLSHYVNATHKNWDERVSFYHVLTSHP